MEYVERPRVPAILKQTVKYPRKNESGLIEISSETAKKLQQIITDQVIAE
jgi:hypothetical protein